MRFELFGLFIHFGHRSYIRYMIYKYFFPVYLVFSFNSVFCRVKVSNFDETQITNFFSFMDLAFSVVSRTLCLTQGRMDFVLF